MKRGTGTQIDIVTKIFVFGKLHFFPSSFVSYFWQLVVLWLVQAALHGESLLELNHAFSRV